MKVNLKINEVVVDYTYDLNPESITFMRPIENIQSIYVPYLAVKINVIPELMTKVVGHQVIDVNLLGRDECEVTLHTRNPNINSKFNKELFDLELFEKIMKDRLSELIKLIGSNPYMKLEDVAHKINNTYDLNYTDDIVSQNIDIRNDEYERQRVEVYNLFNIMRLAIDNMLVKLKEVNRQHIEECLANYSKTFRLWNTLDSNNIKLYLLIQLGIPLNTSEFSYLKQSLSESILGQYIIKKNGW